MDVAEWSYFADAQGSAFSVETSMGACTLVLETAEQLPDSGRLGGAFRLEFRGPASPPLEQATYRFEQGEVSFPIFVVPIASDAAGFRYEAIFN